MFILRCYPVGLPKTQMPSKLVHWRWISYSKCCWERVWFLHFSSASCWTTQSQVTRDWICSKLSYILIPFVTFEGTPEERGLVVWESQLQAQNDMSMSDQKHAMKLYDLPIGMSFLRRYSSKSSYTNNTYKFNIFFQTKVGEICPIPSNI